VKSSQPNRWWYASVNGIVFSVCYLLTNQLAQTHGVVRSIAVPWDAVIPFLPWMILPYLSSSLWLALAFVKLKNPEALRLFSQRLLLGTVLAAVVFSLYPARFSTPRVEINSPAFAALFEALSLIDKPYNQLPSLHITYCVLLLASLRHFGLTKGSHFLAAMGLMLTAASTLFTHQHHLLDVLGGVLLGLVCIACIQPGRSEPHVAFYYLVAALITCVIGQALWPWPLTLYIALSLMLVCLAYAKRQRHFLHKKNGVHPWWVKCLYAPYLLGYWLTWRLVVWHERHRPAIQCVAPNLWTGRRLRSSETTQLPHPCVVFDLAQELSETKNLRSHPYQYFPLPDLTPIAPHVIQDIVTALRHEINAGRHVYLHCAMGYSRCVAIANAYIAIGLQNTGDSFV
jgi:membrane-associated phospholipid phosphatase